MRLLRTALLAALPAALALAIAAAPAAAETTFSGTCNYRGYAQYWPWAHWVPQASGFAFHGTGTCRGTLNGSAFNGPFAIDVYANMHSPMGCTAGGSTQGGPVYMTFITGKPSSAAANAATPAPAHASVKAHKRKKRKIGNGRRHSKRTARHRRAAKRAHAAAAPGATGAGSSGQPPPNPPAPTSPYPMLTAYITEVNVADVFPFVLQGAYRGAAHGQASPEQSGWSIGTECTEGGVPGLWFDLTYTTITPLVG